MCAAIVLRATSFNSGFPVVKIIIIIIIIVTVTVTVIIIIIVVVIVIAYTLDFVRCVSEIP